MKKGVEMDKFKRVMVCVLLLLVLVGTSATRVYAERSLSVSEIGGVEDLEKMTLQISPEKLASILDLYSTSPILLEDRGKGLLVSDSMLVEAPKFKLIGNKKSQYIEINQASLPGSISVTGIDSTASVKTTKINVSWTPESGYAFGVSENQVEVRFEHSLAYVSKKSKMPMSFQVDLKSAGLSGIPAAESGFRVDRMLIEPLKELSEAGKKKGIHFLMTSGYRDEASQRKAIREIEAKYKQLDPKHYKARAAAEVVQPGFSEHQTGLAVDLFTSNRPTKKSFVASKEAAWLAKNAYQYGFVVRYPRNKTAITEVMYEPWHLRYVGKEVALYLHQNNMVYDEFIARLASGKLVDLQSVKNSGKTKGVTALQTTRTIRAFQISDVMCTYMIPVEGDKWDLLVYRKNASPKVH